MKTSRIEARVQAEIRRPVMRDYTNYTLIQASDLYPASGDSDD